MAEEFLPTGLDIDAAQKDGNRLAKKPGADSILPSFARGGGAKRLLINTLLGLSPGQQAAAQSIQLGDPPYCLGRICAAWRKTLSWGLR